MNPGNPSNLPSAAHYDRILEGLEQRFFGGSGPCRSLRDGTLDLPVETTAAPAKTPSNPFKCFPGSNKPLSAMKISVKQKRCIESPDGQHAWRKNGYSLARKQRVTCGACFVSGVAE